MGWFTVHFCGGWACLSILLMLSRTERLILSRKCQWRLLIYCLSYFDGEQIAPEFLRLDLLINCCFYNAAIKAYSTGITLARMWTSDLKSRRSMVKLLLFLFASCGPVVATEWRDAWCMSAPIVIVKSSVVWKGSWSIIQEVWNTIARWLMMACDPLESGFFFLQSVLLLPSFLVLQRNGCPLWF